MVPAAETDDEDAQTFWEGLLDDYDDELGSGDELVADESRLCLSGFFWGGVGGGRACRGGGKGGVRTCCFFCFVFAKESPRKRFCGPARVTRSPYQTVNYPCHLCSKCIAIKERGGLAYVFLFFVGPVSLGFGFVFACEVRFRSWGFGSGVWGLAGCGLGARVCLLRLESTLGQVPCTRPAQASCSCQSQAKGQG